MCNTETVATVTAQQNGTTQQHNVDYHHTIACLASPNFSSTAAYWRNNCFEYSGGALSSACSYRSRVRSNCKQNYLKCQSSLLNYYTWRLVFCRPTLHYLFTGVTLWELRQICLPYVFHMWEFEQADAPLIHLLCIYHKQRPEGMLKATENIGWH